MHIILSEVYIQAVPVLAKVFVVVVEFPGCIRDWSIFEFPQASAAFG